MHPTQQVNGGQKETSLILGGLWDKFSENRESPKTWFERGEVN